MNTMFYYMYFILAWLAVASEAGKCGCRVRKCYSTEDRVEGSCETTASYDRFGLNCCKPFCVCKPGCGAGESDEGQYGIPEWLFSDPHHMRLWEMAHGGVRDAMGSCAQNQTWCCPICTCRKTCNVADTPVQDCGVDHLMCCNITRQVYDCDVTDVMFGTKDGLKECGKCSCQQECPAESVRVMSNRCMANQTLCCGNCSCKPSCDVTEIDKTMEISNVTNQCGEGVRMCCASCRCKPQCQQGEEERGTGSCFMKKRCCDARPL